GTPNTQGARRTQRCGVLPHSGMPAPLASGLQAVASPDRRSQARARAQKKAGGRGTANGIGKEEALMRQRPCRLIRSVFLTVLFLGLAASAQASHLTMDLTVEGKPRAVHAGTDTMPPANGKIPRPVVHTHAGDAVKLRWRVKNA